ncbi:MAG: DNA repair protein RecO [Phycisphaerae bacterium]
MALHKDAAIVLRRLDYSETSQVLVLFTRQHGCQRLIAKGIKRGTRSRVAVGLDLLEMGRVVFSQRSDKHDALAVLTEWRQEDHFPHLRDDLSRCYAAQYAAEVTSELTEPHDPHPALFDGLHRLLRDLEHTAALPGLVGYLWFLLREIGLRPDFSRCINCGRHPLDSAPVYFSAHKGGAICRDCEPALVEKRRIDPLVARALTNGDAPGPADAAQVFDVLDYHLRETMSRPARLSPFLRAALGLPAKL